MWDRGIFSTCDYFEITCPPWSLGEFVRHHALNSVIACTFKVSVQPESQCQRQLGFLVFYLQSIYCRRWKFTRSTDASDAASHWQRSVQSTRLVQLYRRWLDDLCWLWRRWTRQLQRKLYLSLSLSLDFSTTPTSLAAFSTQETYAMDECDSRVFWGLVSWSCQ